MSKKSKKIAIIAGVLLLIVAITAVVLIIMVHKTLSTPTNVEVVMVTAEPDYEITISWNEVDGAIAYGVEYIYELYGETNTINATSPTVTIPRIRGVLTFRVIAYSENNYGDSEWSEWQTYEVSGLTLDLPATLEITYRTTYDNNGNKVYGYSATEDSRTAWENVTYTYGDDVREVTFYEVVVQSPEQSFEVAALNASVQAYTTFTSQWYYGLSEGEWTIYIRAINYQEYQNEMIYDDIELYELYNVNDAWTEINFTVVDEGNND
ncbi:MAG: fibronectin type III domain-containing protein [Bacillota bacterium]